MTLHLYACVCGMRYYDICNFMVHVNHCEGCVDLYRDIPLDRVQDCTCFTMIPRAPHTETDPIVLLEAAMLRRARSDAVRQSMGMHWNGSQWE